jgi:HEAT repeat protein
MFAPSPLPRTLEASVRDLGSLKAATRASAVADLARHARQGDATRTRALPLLEKALGDDVAQVRSAVLVALADLKASELLPAILVAMEDADLHARQMAINAVGEIGDVRATPRLRRALTDRRPEVRYQAVIAFARVAKDDADDVVSALGTAMGDEDESVRYIALRVAEERFDEGRVAHLDALAPRAAALLEGPPHVALVAAIFLAKLGKAEGRALLIRVIDRVAGPTAEKEDEREAVEIAGALQLREAIPALERRAWGLARLFRDTCPFHAKIALARMGHPRATREIVRDLASSRVAEREAAVVAAGRARLVAARGAVERVSGVDHELVQRALGELREEGEQGDGEAGS